MDGQVHPDPFLLEAHRARALRLPVGGRPQVFMCGPGPGHWIGLCTCSLSTGLGSSSPYLLWFLIWSVVSVSTEIF